MPFTVIRQGSHQGDKFVEVTNADKPHCRYAFPGDFPVGTQLEVVLTEVAEEAEVRETKPKAVKGK